MELLKRTDVNVLLTAPLPKENGFSQSKSILAIV